MRERELPRPTIEVKKPSFLEEALGAMHRDMRMKGFEMKHGVRPLRELPQKPKGMATHKGDIY